jgi:glycosyltransferase involved in cell wall biosynthesis
MKLAILAQAWLEDDGFSINGTLVQLHNLAKGFTQQGIEVHYIAQSTKHKNYTTEEKYGISFHWIPLVQGIWAWKKMMPAYKEKLNDIAPDAVYVRGRNVLQYVAGKYAQKHKINFVWGTNGDDSAEFHKNRKRLWSSAKPLYKKVILTPLKAYEDVYINKGMEMATKVVNQSLQQKEATLRILGKEGIVVPSYFLPEEVQVEKENIILWLATLSPKKQPHIFLTLLKTLHFHGSWRGVIGGRSTYKEYTKKIYKDAEGIAQCLGKVPFSESNALYARSKIYINTSLPEADGLPNAYIQSWLNGTVVLSLHHDPNHWMKRHNIGYCAHGDKNALQTKLQLLIDKPQQLEQMSEKAKHFARDTFANPGILKTYLKEFKK